MQKKSLPPLFIVLLIPFLLKAEWISMNKKSASQSPPTVTLISDDNNSTVLKIEISGFERNNFISGNKNYQMIDLLSESFTNIPGFPELPYIAKVLAIPDFAGISVEVLETGEIQTFNNINLPPARESWFEGSIETPHSENLDAYNSMSAYPLDMVRLETPSIFRDFRITRVSVFPVRYIPANKELQVVSSITVRINYGPGEIVNPKTGAPKPISPSFGKLYREFIFNYQSVLNKSYGGKETGHELMLCIMPDNFVASFQTYADWKRRSGIDIHVTKFSDIGATATNPDIIKNHIADAYHNWDVPPTYVLIVGDNLVFPHKIVTYDYSFPNEDFFVEIDGNDYFPELMIGRFTNESDYGIQVMINKFIKYEKTPYTVSTDWFKKGICCSNNAYPSQAETKRYAAQRMLQDGGFTSVDTMMMPVSGCPYNLTDVKNALNNGRSFLNYRGEGWYTGWSSSCYLFSTSDVTTLANGEKFTFVTSIGCGVANFTSTTSGNCFGEEWMETGTIGSPKGAVAFIGPTSNTHTTYNNDIDQGIYKGMFQEGLETAGQALLRGKLYMYNVSGNEFWVEYHYRVYCVLGDPSIHIWKDIPQAITVNYPASITLGNNLVEFTVTHTATGSPVANAVICLTGIDIFTTASTDSDGKAYLELFSEVMETLKVTVRGGNVIPFLGTMDVLQPTGPYVIRDIFSLNDNNGGNGNGLMDYGESILLSLSVKNVGSTQANNVNVTLSTTNSYITFTDNFHNYGNIASNQTILATNAFAFNVANNIPDHQTVLITVTASSGSDTWTSYLSLLSNAPVLSMGTVIISDAGSNSNGYIDPGETATITAVISNYGHSLSPPILVVLSTTSPYITINSGNANPGQIAAGNSANAVFSISCSPSAPIGQTIDLAMNAVAGNYNFIHNHYFTVGLVTEDWETGNFAKLPWTLSGNANWEVATVGQYEGNYTATSGTIEHLQTTSFSMQVLVDNYGTISFYRKTSSELNFDFLRFYIDDVQKGQWSGEVPWGLVSYAITPGIHNLKWSYIKDGLASAGLDRAWVDYITFPPLGILASEISLNPSSFSKSVMSGGSVNDVLNIANSGNVALDFNALVDYSINVSQAYVYPLAIDYWTGTCTSTTKTQVSAVKAVPPSEAGWMKFDVSSIPVGAVINSVEFHGYVYGNYIPQWSITPVSVDPVTANPSVLYPDINAEGNSGYYLYRNETATLSVGWKTHMLGGNINSDLAAALAQGWFAIGVMDRDPGTNYINFNGCNSSNKPYLVVNYTHPPPPTWLKINGGTTIAGSVAAGNNQNINVSFEAGAYPEGTYNANIKITSNDPDESQLIIPCTMVIIGSININLKALLEGPFKNETTMSTFINSLLPLSQPYNAAPWNYTGTESLAVMPANVVDWVLVELRDATSAINATSGTRIARQAALLLNSGNIVDMGGTSPLLFTSSVTNNLYVVIHHRNHLSILSANAVNLSGDTYNYDFRMPEGKAYGTNSQKELTDGYWGMWVGDANGNGTIGTDDLIPAWKSNAGKMGYYPADLNFDRQVNNKDKNNCWQPNFGKGCQVPE
jgi:hypothetical protein